MAGEGTHMRFALALKDKLEILDLEKFIAGTVYPDSRYISGIARGLTHGENLVDKSFLVNDFNRGWSVHYLCDKYQQEVMRDLFPEIMNDLDRDRWWVNISALKNVQDLCDIKKFDVQPLLKYLDNAINPNGEDVDKVKEFYRIIQKMYADEIVTVENFRVMWLALGLKPDIVDKLIETTIKFLDDEKTMLKIDQMFDRMILKV